MYLKVPYRSVYNASKLHSPCAIHKLQIPTSFLVQHGRFLSLEGAITSLSSSFSTYLLHNYFAKFHSPRLVDFHQKIMIHHLSFSRVRTTATTEELCRGIFNEYKPLKLTSTYQWDHGGATTRFPNPKYAINVQLHHHLRRSSTHLRRRG